MIELYKYCLIDKNCVITLRYGVIFLHKKRYKPYKMGVIRIVKIEMLEKNMLDSMKKQWDILNIV